MSCPFLMSCLRHLSSPRLQSPVVKLAVATGYVAECSTIARLCPSRGSGDRPHRPLSGGPPVSPRRHTIFLKSQCLIESDDGLSKNSETPKKGLQLLYKGCRGLPALNSFHSISWPPSWIYQWAVLLSKAKALFWSFKYYLHALFFCRSHGEL